MVQNKENEEQQKTTTPGAVGNSAIHQYRQQIQEQAKSPGGKAAAPAASKKEKLRESAEEGYQKHKKRSGKIPMWADIPLSMAAFTPGMVGAGGLGATALQSGIMSKTTSGKTQTAQQRRQYQKQLGASGRVEQGSRILQSGMYAGFGANAIKGALGGGGGSINPFSPIYGGLGALAGGGMAGTAAASGGLALPAILSSMKTSKKMKSIRVQKGNLGKLESQHSLSKNMGASLNKLRQSNQLQGADEIKTRLMMWIEAHTSIIPLLYDKIRMMQEQKEKGTESAKEGYRGVFSGKDEEEGVGVVGKTMNRMEDTINKFTSQFDPFTQLSNLIFAGKTPKQMAEEIGGTGEKEEEKRVEAASAAVGMPTSAQRLIESDSLSLTTGKEYEESMFTLSASKHDLLRYLLQETVSIRKHGFGIEDNAFKRQMDQSAVGGIIQKLKELPQHIPGISALANLIKAPSTIVEKITEGGAWLRDKLFGKGFLETLTKEGAEKEAGIGKSLDQKYKEFIVEGLPDLVETLRVVNVRQLEAQQNIYQVLKNQYELLSAVHTGEMETPIYKELAKEEKEKRAYDPYEAAMLTAEALEKAEEKRAKQRRQARVGRAEEGILGKLLGGERVEGMSEKLKGVTEKTGGLINLVGPSIGQVRGEEEEKEEERRKTVKTGKAEDVTEFSEMRATKQREGPRGQGVASGLGILGSIAATAATGGGALPLLLGAGSMGLGMGEKARGMAEERTGFQGYAQAELGTQGVRGREVGTPGEELRQQLPAETPRAESAAAQQVTPQIDYSKRIFLTLGLSRQQTLIDFLSEKIGKIVDIISSGKDTLLNKLDEVISKQQEHIDLKYTDLDKKIQQWEISNKSIDYYWNYNFALLSQVYESIESLKDINKRIEEKVEEESEGPEGPDDSPTVLQAFVPQRPQATAKGFEETTAKAAASGGIFNPGQIIVTGEPKKSAGPDADLTGREEIIKFRKDGKIEVIGQERTSKIFNRYGIETRSGIKEIGDEIKLASLGSRPRSTRLMAEGTEPPEEEGMLASYLRSIRDSILNIGSKMIELLSDSREQFDDYFEQTIKQEQESVEENVNQFQSLKESLQNQTATISQLTEITGKTDESAEGGMMEQLQDVKKGREKERISDRWDQMIDYLAEISDTTEDIYKRRRKREREQSGILGTVVGKIGDLLSMIGPLVAAALPVLGMTAGAGAFAYFTEGQIGGKAIASIADLATRKVVGFFTKIIDKIGTSLVADFSISGIISKYSSKLLSTMTSGIKVVGESLFTKLTKLFPEAAQQVGKLPLKKVFGNLVTYVGKMLGIAKGGLGKGLAKMGLKKIPGLGAILGFGFGIHRFTQGKWFTGLLEIASGLASTFPGIGTGISIGIDALIALSDMLGGGEEKEGDKKKGKSWLTTFSDWVAEKFTGFMRFTFRMIPFIGPILSRMIFGDGKKEMKEVDDAKKEAKRKAERNKQDKGWLTKFGNYIQSQFKTFLEYTLGWLPFGESIINWMFGKEDKVSEIEKAKKEVKKESKDTQKSIIQKIKDAIIDYIKSAASSISGAFGWVASKIFGSGDQELPEGVKKAGDKMESPAKKLKESGNIDEGWFNDSIKDFSAIRKMKPGKVENLLERGGWTEDTRKKLKEILKEKMGSEKTKGLDKVEPGTGRYSATQFPGGTKSGGAQRSMSGGPPGSAANIFQGAQRGMIATHPTPTIVAEDNQPEAVMPLTKDRFDNFARNIDLSKLRTERDEARREPVEEPRPTAAEETPTPQQNEEDLSEQIIPYPIQAPNVDKSKKTDDKPTDTSLGDEMDRMIRNLFNNTSAAFIETGKEFIFGNTATHKFH